MKRTGKFFVVYSNNKESSAAPRLDVVVSLKISKKAVLRNKIKRQVREILRGFFKQPGGCSLPDLKIVALSGILAAKFTELKSDLDKILNSL